MSSKYGCKQCRSLGFLYSDIAKEWDYEKNNDLDPNQIAAKTSKVVWWRCSKCGHSYQMRIDSRTVKGVGCQACKGKQLHVGLNDLKSSHLDILDE